MLPGLLIGSIINGVLGAGKSIFGADKADKAARDAAKDVQPKYATPQSEKDNEALLENLAGSGLSPDSKQIYTQNADRGLSSTIEAILKGGGDVNSVGKVYDNYNNDMSQLALLNEKEHLGKIMAVVENKRRLSDYSDKEWMMNQYAPWVNRQQKYAQKQAEGKADMSQGMNMFVNAVSSLAGGFKPSTNDNTGGNASNKYLG